MPEEKSCTTCLYLATHEACGNPGQPSYCLGTREEQEANGGKFAFKHWKEGSWDDAYSRLKELQKKGKRSIVIGGQGEAEVITTDPPEVTLENLCRVAEHCGYMVNKGQWSDHVKEIHVFNHGHYRLDYEDGRLVRIVGIIERVTWQNQ